MERLNNSEVESSSLMDFYEHEGSIADHQDKMYSEGDFYFTWWQNGRMKSIINLLRRRHFSISLDVGCAEGIYTSYLASISNFAIGCDISRPKLKRALTKGRSQNNISYVQADASALPFRESNFDCAICVDTIRYTNDLGRTISEVFRVSRGAVIVQNVTSFYEKVSYIHILDSSPIRLSSEELLTRMSIPYQGAFWIISGRALKNVCLNRAFKPIKIRRLEGMPAFWNFKIFTVNKHLFRATVRIAQFFSTKPMFNLLGGYSTILFEIT